MYTIAKEYQIHINVPKDKERSVFPQKFYVKIDICKFDLNNSYVKDNNITFYFYNSFSKYYSSNKITNNYPEKSDSSTTVEKKFFIHFKVTHKDSINSLRLAELNLYIINNDNNSLINICDLLSYNNVKFSI